MKLHEMDGFLKGKCLPGDMLVNETTAEYLVRKFAELQSALDLQSARSDALAAKLNDVCAENAALKAICEDRRTFIMNGVQLGYIQVPTVETDPALETIRIAVSPQEPTPATDAWVNEQRAVGATQVETNLRACYEEFPESSRDIVDECIQIAASTAAQLRGSQV